MDARIFIIETQEHLERFTRFIGKQPVPLEIEVREYVEKRSLAQNKRLWKLHGLAADQTGYTPLEMHELCLCEHYGGVDKELKNPFTGAIEIKRVPLKRSSARNKKEFRLFLDFVENWYIENLSIWLNQDE